MLIGVLAPRVHMCVEDPIQEDMFDVCPNITHMRVKEGSPFFKKKYSKKYMEDRERRRRRKRK